MNDDGQELLGALSPFVDDEHRSTIGVLVWVLRTGRQLEAWLSGTLADGGLDPSEFTALMALLLAGDEQRLSAGEISSAIVQTTGGTTKTIRRLEGAGLVRRVADPGDKRRTLLELTAPGAEAAQATLALVLDAFELEIGDLDVSPRTHGGSADNTNVGLLMAQLSTELEERLRAR